jgi:hypothetical protein
MAKLIMLILGLLFLGGGIFLAYLWWDTFLAFISALLVLILVIAGIVILVLAIGEIVSRKKN